MDNHRGGQAPTPQAAPRGGRRTNTARPTMRGAPQQRSTPGMWRATRQHSTPHHGGEHTPTHHAPPWGRACTNTARSTMGGTTHEHNRPHHEGGPRTNTKQTPARQTTQTQPQPNRRQNATKTRRPKRGKDDAQPTKQAAHGASQTTTSPNSTIPAGRQHRQRQPKPSTTQLRQRHTNTMRRAHPDHSTIKPTPNRPPSTRPKQQCLNAAGGARAGPPTVHLTQITASTRCQTTTGNVTRRVVQRQTRAQPTNTETCMTTTRTRSDRASAIEPTPNKPAMRRLRQPCTNKTAAAATI